MLVEQQIADVLMRVVLRFFAKALGNTIFSTKTQKMPQEDSEEENSDSEEFQEFYENSLIKQLPDILLPSGTYLVGKEVVFGIAPLNSLPQRYRFAKEQDKFPLDDYITDSACALAPEFIFLNKSSRQILARKAVVVFLKNKHIFFNQPKSKKPPSSANSSFFKKRLLFT